MRNIIVLLTAIAMTGCATVPQQTMTPEQKREQTKKLVVTVATLAVVLAVGGALGKENQKSKCANNRAGFWVDNYSGKVYACP